MSTPTIALIVGLMALVAILVGLLAGSAAAFLSRHDGDGWTSIVRHGGRGFARGLGTTLAFYTAFIAPFVVLVLTR